MKFKLWSLTSGVLGLPFCSSFMSHQSSINQRVIQLQPGVHEQKTLLYFAGVRSTSSSSSSSSPYKESLRLHHRFNPQRINEDGSSKDIETILPTVGVLDLSATVKYFLAITIQMSLFAGIFAGLDALVDVSQCRSFLASSVVMKWIHGLVFYVIALKSRFLNPLSNRRPKPKTKEIQDSKTIRKMPSWTPPGFVFPIVWLLIIGPLRAVSSSIVVAQSGGIYANRAIFALLLHLCIGDVWNTINNVEKRYGTAVLGVMAVWLSALNAAIQFSHVSIVAGKLLSVTLVWLTIASSLIIRTWQLNPIAMGGVLRKAPLLPTQGDGYTRFQWFSS